MINFFYCLPNVYLHKQYYNSLKCQIKLHYGHSEFQELERYLPWLKKKQASKDNIANNQADCHYLKYITKAPGFLAVNLLILHNIPFTQG